MYGATITTRFEAVKAYGEKSGKCPVCGKRVKRKKTFEGTINPFNKNEAGQVKSRSEVYADQLAKVKAWELLPIDDHCN